jgi:hypothetical protein
MLKGYVISRVEVADPAADARADTAPRRAAAEIDTALTEGA